jgi:predicted DNA-binding protein YlxM (UPF0122 family)
MPYLTIAEYANKEGCSRQAIEDRIKRGTLDVVIRSVKTKRKYIYVKEKSVDPLAPSKEGV